MSWRSKVEMVPSPVSSFCSNLSRLKYNLQTEVMVKTHPWVIEVLSALG